MLVYKATMFIVALLITSVSFGGESRYYGRYSLDLNPQIENQRIDSYIRKCLQKKNEGETLKINKVWPTFCSSKPGEEPVFIDYSGKFTLTKVNNRLQMTVSVLFPFYGADENFEFTKGRLVKTLNVIKAVYKLNHIELKINFRFIKANSLWDKAKYYAHYPLYDHVVSVIEGRQSIRPRSDIWDMDSWRSDSVVFAQSVHEFSHLIGLEDSYGGDYGAGRYCVYMPVLESGPFISSESGALPGVPDTERYFAFYQIQRITEDFCH